MVQYRRNRVVGGSYFFDDYPAHWQAIKTHFVKRLHRLGIRGKAGPDGAAGIWQRRWRVKPLADE